MEDLEADWIDSFYLMKLSLLGKWWLNGLEIGIFPTITQFGLIVLCIIGGVNRFVSITAGLGIRN